MDSIDYSREMAKVLDSQCPLLDDFRVLSKLRNEIIQANSLEALAPNTRKLVEQVQYWMEEQSGSGNKQPESDNKLALHSIPKQSRLFKDRE